MTIRIIMNEHVSNFSSPELERVISLPASQSLRASAPSHGLGALPTGLNRLDEALSPLPSHDLIDSTQSQRTPGIPRGHVTEIYGPPGVGKTTVAVKVAANALQAGDHVVWIDTGSPIPPPRLKAILLGSIQQATNEPLSTSEYEGKIDDCMNRFIYFRAQSLPHLLALLLHPPASFPPDGTSLLVVDSVSGPFPPYFPNATELKLRLDQGRVTDNQQLKWLLNRRWNVTSDMAYQLVKLASSHRLAVVLLNQTHTKIKGQPRATLYPALAGGSWENCIHTRVVLYRDWPPEGFGETADAQNVRFAEVMKRGGKVLSVRTEDSIVPFLIESEGLRETHNIQPLPSLISSQQATATPVQQRKRKVDEIADSEDEDEEGSDADYGWIEGDDAQILADDQENGDQEQDNE